MVCRHSHKGQNSLDLHSCQIMEKNKLCSQLVALQCRCKIIDQLLSDGKGFLGEVLDIVLCRKSIYIQLWVSMILHLAHKNGMNSRNARTIGLVMYLESIPSHTKITAGNEKK